MTSVETKIALGELPPFWDCGVLFFSNIHSIFYDNVEGSKELIEAIAGATTYGGRVLSILDLLFRRGPNLILLEAKPDEILCRYLSDTLGLRLPEHAILSRHGYQTLPSVLSVTAPAETALATLRDHPAPWVDGFVTDATLVKIAAALGKRTVTTLEGSKNGNNKYLLYRHQVEQKLPVFDTLLAADQDQLRVRLQELRRMGYANAVVKAQIGASGYGMLKLQTDEPQREAVPDYLFFEGPCMVQGWIDDEDGKVRKIGSPSVQMFLNENTLFLFDWTEQILSDESVHQGNMSPPLYHREHPTLQRELLRQAGIVGRWLHSQGYRGTASSDFLVIERAESLEVILCEINARVTGATYPAVLARYFKPRGTWYMRNIAFRRGLESKDLMTLMERAGVLYRPGATKGMIPFNFNTDSEGKVIKGQFVCVGDDYNECGDLLARAWARLPVEWGYDRD